MVAFASPDIRKKAVDGRVIERGSGTCGVDKEVESKYRS